jgi:hypothetical protein
MANDSVWRMTIRRLLVAALCVVPGWGMARGAVDLPPQLLPILGGSGGTSFTRSCGADKVLTGLQYRAALVVDAIGVLCRPVLATGALGSQSVVGTMVGGGGGTAGTINCPSGTVVTAAKITFGTYVDDVEIHCRTWYRELRRWGGGPTEIRIHAVSEAKRHEWTQCESTAQPVVAIRGRARELVDAIGFTCDEP